MPGTSGIVVPESVDDHIPQWTETVDHEAFSKWDPDVVNDEATAGKIR